MKLSSVTLTTNVKFRLQQLIVITRITTKKILGVTVSIHLAMSEHINQVVSNCAQTRYAIRVLKAHGTNRSTIQITFKAAVIAKVMYTGSAW